MPNVIIELKKDVARKNAYEQVVRYLKWLNNIIDLNDFDKVNAYIIAPRIAKIKKNSVSGDYQDKIKMYSIELHDFVPLVE